MSTHAHHAARTSFFETHILPALLVFVIPSISILFFSHAEAWMDSQVLHAVEADVTRNNLPVAEKSAIIDFYRQMPASQFMASSDPEMARIQLAFESTKLHYLTFRWMKRLGWTCLAIIVATLIVVGVSVAFSLRSHSAQYYALRVGWPVLRSSAAIQVLGQAVLAVALSYWGTVIFFGFYVPKLIGVIAVIAGIAVLALLIPIFAKPDQPFAIDGELLTEDDAPALWQRVREIAARFSTDPPDRIIVGISPNFFVTEHRVALGPDIYRGRTLYASLPLIKVLSLEETDGVLGHELAHFSGEDTLWALRISPLKRKFAMYLEALAHGLSLAVAHFMHVFWKLYELSIKRLSRLREFRADRVAAELTSPESFGRALIKITSYCHFRAETELAILAGNRVDSDLDLPRRLEQAFPAFLAAFISTSEAIEERIPHPFDSHPTLSNRLQHLGLEPREALQDPGLLETPSRTWSDAIKTGPELESRFWNKEQGELQEFHEQDLVYRLPKNEDQAALLRELFPRVVFSNLKGGEAVLEFDRIELPQLSSPLYFDEILMAEIVNNWVRKSVVLTHACRDESSGNTTNINLRDYAEGAENMLTTFRRYYGRHKMAQTRSAATV
jgi:Zn-dependent protease with chaperone function